MNKLALSAALASLAVFPVLSQAAQTDGVSSSSSTSTYGASTTTPTYGANIDSNWQDDFFVAGQLGQSQFRGGGYTHNQSVFQNVRFGWRWDGIIGPEIGYAYLGRPKFVDLDTDLGVPGSVSTKTRALTIGLNGKFNVYQNWYITAHAGYLRSQAKNVVSIADVVLGDETNYNNGWYGGLGVGYDVTPHFSVGINYDNYHVDVSRSSDVDTFGPGVVGSGNVATYSVSVEYRF